MSSELNGKWTAHDVYTAVREDRRDIVTKARNELGIIVDNNKSKDVPDIKNQVFGIFKFYQFYDQ